MEYNIEAKQVLTLLVLVHVSKCPRERIFFPFAFMSLAHDNFEIRGVMNASHGVTCVSEDLKEVFGWYSGRDRR